MCLEGMQITSEHGLYSSVGTDEKHGSKRLLDTDICQHCGLELTCLPGLRGAHLSCLPREEELRLPTG